MADQMRESLEDGIRDEEARKDGKKLTGNGSGVKRESIEEGERE